jgi:hypothetical protein
MKRTPLVLLTVFLFLILATATVYAAGQSQTESPFSNFSFVPETPYPGQEMVGTIHYDSAAISGKEVTYKILYELPAEGIVAVCPGNDCKFTPDASGESSFHFYAPDKVGTYNLILTLTVGEQTQTLEPKSLTVESALPEGLAQIFAGLGLFAAIMAVMAVGTEVVIETLKMLLGFKSKVTAMEALDELKAELPGMLAGVGVDAETRKKVSDLADQTKDFLKPVDDVSSIYANLKDGYFVEAYKALKELQDNTDKDKVDQLKEGAKSKTKEGLINLQAKLHLDSNLTDDAEKYIMDLIEKFPDNITDSLVNEVFSILHTIFKNPKKVEEWLLSQMDTYITQGEAGLIAFLTEAKQEIGKLGFTQDKLNSWLDQAVVAVGHTARDKAQVYAHSVKNLLEQVEERRNEMQSPFRKLWRRLRESQLPNGEILTILILAILPALLWGIFHLWPLNTLDENVAWWGYWLDTLILSFFFGIVTFAISYLVLIMAKKDIQPEPKENSPAKGTLGYVLRYYIERAFNIIIGHGSEVDDAANYGNVATSVKEQLENVNPTTVGSILLTLENEHQDEETSRIRWMRIFSIVIGIVLAYYLRVDTATYLGYAVPKVEATINAIDLNKLAFVQRWFPDGLTVGMILTGFAASAGSKFWRDLLGRLQAARGQAEEAAQVVSKVKSTISDLKS